MKLRCLRQRISLLLVIAFVSKSPISFQVCRVEKMSSPLKDQKAWKKDPRDLVRRGSRNPAPVGTAVFVGLRSLDSFLQYGILAQGLGSSLLHRLGAGTLPPGAATTTGTFLDDFGLSAHRLVLLGMATGSAVKQIFWLLVTSQEEFPPSAAIPVSIFNTVFNSLNDLLFTCSLTSAALSPPDTPIPLPLIVGSVLYVFGILTETISEVQRSNFKKDPKNKGKLYTGGLFKYARHINYTGYSFWRAGYSMAAGGWIWGSAVFALFIWDFSNRAIAILGDYTSHKVCIPQFECR